MQSVLLTYYYFETKWNDKREGNIVTLRLIAAALLGLWLLFILLGKGGFIHLFLLSAIGIAFVDAVGTYRGRMTT